MQYSSFTRFIIFPNHNKFSLIITELTSLSLISKKKKIKYFIYVNEADYITTFYLISIYPAEALKQNKQFSFFVLGNFEISTQTVSFWTFVNSKNIVSCLRMILFVDSSRAILSNIFRSYHVRLFVLCYYLNRNDLIKQGMRVRHS